jgi:hypothetical protein
MKQQVDFAGKNPFLLSQIKESAPCVAFCKQGFFPFLTL